VAVLEHQGDCVASWIYFPGEGTITCPGCRSRYASTPERQFAVAFDQILTQHMQRLANDGAAILALERSG
jgi:hypothetical protein